MLSRSAQLHGGLVVAAVTLSAAAAHAAMVPILDSGANALQRSGATMTGVVLDGQTITSANLTQVTITSWAGASSGNLLVANTGLVANNNITLASAARRALIETDWRLDTGFINPAANVGAVGVSFNKPVVNRPGVDLLFFEIDTDAPPDNVKISINSTTLTTANTNWGNSGYTTASADVLKVRNAGNTADLTPTDLNTLLTNPLQVNSDNISQIVFGVGLDFSDFGVAAGASVSNFTFWSTSTSASIDPVIIVGVPEPTGLAALSLLVAPTFLRRRRSGR